MTSEVWPPDYAREFCERERRYHIAKANPAAAAAYYATRPVEWIEHWGLTYDPRNAGTDKPASMPFVLFKRQREFVEFLLACISAEKNGLCEKSRDMGATWLCAAFSVWLWLYWPGAAIGWGSRKELLVDKLGDPDSIFEKIRIIIRGIPRFMWPDGFNPKDHATYMKVLNPATGSTITGEAGDNIGRGGRKLVYFKDESAHYAHPESIEAALGDTTRVMIDISSVNGLGNVFHRARESGTDWSPGAPAVAGVNVFVMDWTDHPGKTQDWYDARRAEAESKGLLHKFAQEVDRDYSAAVENVIIPAIWVKAAIDAHIKLGIEISGPHIGALDVADEGGDLNAGAVRQGILLKAIDEWGERDTGVTTRRGIKLVEPFAPLNLEYDCIGVGAGVKAEANRLLDEDLMPTGISLVPWNAAAQVKDPDKHVIEHDKKSPLNRDFYQNLKAQAWWMLRRRFETTFRAINEPGFTYDPDDLVSISSDIPTALLHKLQKELSQATTKMSGNMKLMVDKKPEGTRSPNIADSVVMAFWPVGRPPLIIPRDALMRARLQGMRPRR